MLKNILIISLMPVILFSCNTGNRQSGDSVQQVENIVFIVVDDLNTTLGCYGHPVVKTPNIDRLAESGILFEEAHCNFSVCNPSRSSFLSGLLPETTTIIDNRKPLQSILDGRKTLPGFLKEHGYYTMSLGKVFHRMEEEHNDMEAWDEIYGFSATEKGKEGERRNMSADELRWCWWMMAEGGDKDQPDGQLAAKAVEFIKAEHEKPFFLAVGLHKPHDPFIAPKNYFDLYPLDKCDPPDLPEGWAPVFDHSLPGQTSIFNRFTEQDKREFLRSYYACTSFMDAQVGKVMDALRESGQLDNTLVVFFGDHGYHLGEHNWWNKVTIYEKGTNAPFIVSGPGVASGQRTGAMIEFIDIYPTLLEMAGLENIPDHLEGKSFATVLEDPSQEFRSEVRAIVRRGDMIGKTVKNKRFRYIEWDEGREGRELYDQENDPIEYNNLAEDSAYAEVISEMQALITYNH